MALRKSVPEIVEESNNTLVHIHQSWERISLADVADVLNGYAFKSNQFNSKGEGMPLIRIRDVNSNQTNTYYVGDYDDRYIIENGDLIIGMDGDFNCVLWQGGSALLNQRVCKVTLETNDYDLKFLYFALPGYLNEIHKNTSSVTVKHLSSKSIAEIPLPLPSVAEQKRIVAEIEKQFTRLDQAVASLKRLQSNLARYKASVLKAACEGRLVPQDTNEEPAADLLARILTERRAQWEKQEWQNLIVKAQKKAAQGQRKKQGLPTRIKDLQPGEWEAIAEADYARYLPKNDKWKEKYKEPAGVETAVLPDLPEGWVWASMDGLSDIVSGVAKGRKFKDQETVHLPYLRVANVQQGYLNLSQIKKIEARPDELEKYRLQENDLLLTEGGDWDKLGRSAIWKGQVPDCIHQNHIFRARPWHPDLSTVWLMYVTNSEHGRKYFANSSKQTTNLASINLTQLRACPVPLPSKSEMERIINEIERRLSVVAATEQAIIANLARAGRLRQSILGRAFSGQLVPQNIVQGRSALRPYQR